MANRKGVNISENYAVYHKLYLVCLFHIIFTLYSKN